LNRAERRYRLRLEKKGQTFEADKFLGFNVDRQVIEAAELSDQKWFREHPGEVLHTRPYIPGEYVPTGQENPEIGDWTTAKFVLVAARLDVVTGFRMIYRKPFSSQEAAEDYKQQMLARLAA
jgi:hypothetical protein